MKRYIDDQWREILAGQGFGPRTEEGAEVWRRPGVDALIQITHTKEGDPVWLFYVNQVLVEKGDDSESLLHFVEAASTKDEYVEYEKQLNADDNQWLRSIGISLREVNAFPG